MLFTLFCLALAEPPVAGPPPPPGAERTYQENVILTQDYILSTYTNGAYSGSSTGMFVYKGIYKEPLKGAQLYRELQRSDLEAKYKTRNRNRLLAILGGSVVAIGGSAYALSGVDNLDTAIRRLGTGMGVMAGGGLIAMVGAFTTPHPVKAPEVRRLAAERNAALAAELGLTAEQANAAVDRGLGR